RGVPAPVDEDRGEESGREHGSEVEGERVEPVDVDGDGNTGNAVAGANLHQGEHGEDDQHDDLDREQDLLELRRDLDTAVADPGHQGDPDETGGELPPVVR